MVPARDTRTAIVVGAGIGGLATAAALRRCGWQPIVLERAAELRPVGAAIGLAPNAIRVLEALGVGEAVLATGAQAASAAILTADGHVLCELPADLAAGSVAILRSDLQAILAHGDERLGAEVSGVSPDGSVRLTDGTVAQASLVVGADGLHSVVRRGVAPGGRLRYAGYTAWRGVVDLPVEPGRWTESWGRGGRFGLVDVGHGRTYWFATANVAQAAKDEGRPELLDRFARWHDPIEAIITATPAEAIVRHDVYDLDPLPRWSAGVVTLLGDAAHAATPALGQGAAQALEDVIALVDALSTRADVETAVRTYECRRRARATTMMRLARRFDRLAQLESPALRRLRDLIVGRAPETYQRRQYEAILRPTYD
jgi:2-polyprenyl-6-methoxyphenol hydroxylase-like FAD-dependent oxidoreductase